jgi:serine/threonine protein kinase
MFKNAERWQQIENLCLEALERESDKRAGFLDAACVGDADLRREIESLLKYAELTDDPLDRSTGAGVTQLVRESIEPTLRPGTIIGHYRIDAVLGTGGMGKVYRAIDTRLGRAVALKFLNRLFFADGSERLVREARAAAKLDHPNICSIYEVVGDQGRCFIAMQYVEGDTLSNRIAREAIDVREALEIASQIADALAEAHAKGVVHRDIKPQNIMITPRRQAKVLDFGLAASVTPVGALGGKSGGLDSVSGTEAIAGTVPYMSPEQALGQELDARTDLYSLAVVLFEMATGVSPFQSTIVALTRDAILDHPPPAPRQINGNLPPELERIILKGLEKDRELRYQSAAELLADLQRLQRQLEVEQSTSTPLVSRNRSRVGYALAALAVAGLVPAFGLFRSHAPESDADERRYVQLTTFTDSATNPAVSPDGRMLAFIRGSSTFLNPGQVYVKRLPDGEPVALTNDNRPKMSPIFSPDGSRIAYTILTPSEWATWVVPAVGGEPRPLLANAAALTWFGDRRILFSKIRRDQHMVLVTGTEGLSDVRDVYVPPTETGMAHRSQLSPDRKWVLISSEMNTSGWLPCRVMPLEGGLGGRIVGPLRAKCTYAAWSPDGKRMYFSADVGEGFHIWRQRFPDGAPEQITFGATEEEGIAMWPDGRFFASSVGTTISSVWIHDAGKERQITSEGYGHLPSFSADGKKLYYLLRSSGVRQWASGELWAFDLSTGSRRRVFDDISMAQYEVSRDDARVVFVRTDPGKEGVWVARIDDHVPPAQVSSKPATRAFFGPAGTVVFQAEEGQTEYLFRVREDGSSLQKVTTEPIIWIMSVSPDQRWAVVWTAGSRGAMRPMDAYPINGGHPVRLCDNCSRVDGPRVGHSPPMLAWSPDGQYVYMALQPSGDTQSQTGKTYAVRLAGTSALPPPFEDESDMAAVPSVQLIPQAGIFPGPTPSLYAYTRTTTHRNIYRIPTP